MSTSAHSLDIATPERVSLSLPVAGIGYRSLAYLIDLLLLFTFWVVAYFVFSFLAADVLGAFESLSGFGKTLLIVGLFASQWLYWSLFEILWNGQTPGKRAMRIRVARVDGSPAGVLESAVRNLCRAVDFLPAFYAAGVLTMLLNDQNRRLGDLVAGTVLLRDERIDLEKYTAQAAAESPAGSATAPLPADDVELILSFLSRAAALEPEARLRLTRALVERYGSSLSPEERAAVTASLESSEAYLRRRAQARG